jgi:hypothetical protein
MELGSVTLKINHQHTHLSARLALVKNGARTYIFHEGTVLENTRKRSPSCRFEVFAGGGFLRTFEGTDLAGRSGYVSVFYCWTFTILTRHKRSGFGLFPYWHIRILITVGKKN